MADKLEPTTEADFTFAEDSPFLLDGGGQLRPVTLRYAVYGAINAACDNVILVCHALSGSARVFDWWPELFGEGRPLDLSRFAVIGVNVLGSCYGSTGPAAVNPETGQPYRDAFPVVSIRDMVRAQVRLIDHLGVVQLYSVIGGSIGGMQALAWATDYPDRVGRCIAVGACPLSAMGLAMSHLQRQAIRLDPVGGLALARGLAMCTYKSAELLEQRFARKPDRSGEDPTRSHEGRFDVGGYLDYQGRLFLDRFDPGSYRAVSRAMDTFDLGDEIASIRARVLLVGIRSDWLFPPGDVRKLGERLTAVGVDANYHEIDSTHGHDGFLADSDKLIPLMMPMLE